MIRRRYGNPPMDLSNGATGYLARSGPGPLMAPRPMPETFIAPRATPPVRGAGP